jgi:hypothetical protein
MDDLTLAVAPREQGKASSLELPWRLLLALQDKARCRHRSTRGGGSEGVTEMWNTRVLAPSLSRYSEVFPFASLPLETPFALSTPLRDKVPEIAARGRANPGLPVRVDKLILTTCGAWVSGSIRYPDLDWTHRTAMGRDFYVRLAMRGVLFPFGHDASVVSVTERTFDGSTKTAGLQQIFALLITQPARDYGIDEAPHQREFPFHRVEIEPVEVIPLDPPPTGARSFWLEHNGSAVMFTIRASSADGVVPMQLPLIFSEMGTNAQQLVDAYAQGPRAGVDAAPAPPTALVNRRIPLVVRRTAGQAVEAVEGATQQVRSVTLGANIVPGGVGFHPRLAELEVTLPAVQQLLGQEMAAIRATLAPEVRNATATAPPPFLLQFAPRALNFAAARAAVVAAPNMAVDRIHRELGPTVASLPTDPKKLFDRSAKVLGVVPLVDLIGTITGRPTITWSQTPSPHAILTWKEALTTESGPFKPGSGCKVALVVKTVLDGTQPKTTTDGTITNFVIGIPSPKPEAFLVRLDFEHLTFHAEPGKLPDTRFKITAASLGKKLRFVQQLSSHLPAVGNKAPVIDIDLREVRVRYAIAIPTPLSMGLFTLQNLLLQAGITLSLGDQPVVIDFAFGTRAHPFLVTVMGFGGGGYLELGIRAGGADSGLERFVGGIEFGAAVAMNFGVAAGEVHVFGGIVFTKQGGEIEIAGYLRIGGSVRVLGLITVSVELTLSLTYVAPNILRGAAKLVIAVDLTFWSTSVEIGTSYELVGSSQTLAGHDPFVPDAEVTYSVQDALGPVGASFPWQTYCQAFARE